LVLWPGGRGGPENCCASRPQPVDRARECGQTEVEAPSWSWDVVDHRVGDSASTLPPDRREMVPTSTCR
jgi:hypothetical protein